jgi:mannose-6-phosphate isomerase-like protein (cupin superfamily)
MKVEGSLEGITMYALVRKPDPTSEFMTRERCQILEAWNDVSDPGVSIARAKVAVGVTTQLHRLNGINERYLVIQGIGMVKVGDLAPETVRPGDVVVIPAGTPQQISNRGPGDLIFYCICSPRFLPSCYETVE